jgi:nucleoside-diphosphate-sugar epimerase
MRVLVTGAAGFIGSNVVRALAAGGAEVVAVDRPMVSWLRLTDLPSGAAVDEVDLGVPAGVEALVLRRRPEVLVHLAWNARPEDYLTSRENLRSLSATVDLARAALDAGCRRVVGVGTCLEYAVSDRPHREGDAAGPDTLYAACKHAARLITEKLAAAAGASFAWARVFHLHGPGEDPRRLVPMVAGKLRCGEPIDLSPGEQVRDYLRVEDVADAIAATALSEATGTVNVCSGAPLTLRALLVALAEAVGHPELLRFGAIPYRTGERMAIAGEPGVLRALGWAPRHSTLAAALRYLAS